jgi:glycopeptide antibiotics resistance protein
MTFSNRIGVWTIFLVGWILLIIVLCSFPWWVEAPRWDRVRWIPFQDVLRGPRWVLRDAIANCLLYIPFGVAYARVRGITGAKSAYEAVLAALSLSIACEFYQIFSPVRFPSMTDVLTNTIGAVAGASLAGKSAGSSSKK